MTTTTTAGPDGVLALSVPLGPQAAGKDYDVTITPKRKALTREEWHAFVDRTAGSITDPGFERPPQLEYETREPLS